MPIMPPLPMDRFLTPDPPPRGEGFATVKQELVRGVPFEWVLAGDVTLALVVPTGTARTWRDADPAALVSAGADETGAHAAPRGIDPLERAPARLLLRQSRTIRAVLPLAAGTRRILPDGPGDRALVELVIVDWRLHAGTVRGAGDFGSFVEIAWRPVGKGADTLLDPLAGDSQRGGFLP